MSKQTSNRLKNEKNKIVSSSVVNQDIIPKEITEFDWYVYFQLILRNTAIADDESSQYVYEIIHELIDLVLNKIYLVYLNNQLVPFTVFQATEAITEVIQVIK